MFSANLLHLERDTTVGTFRARFLEQRRHGDREAVRPGAAGVLASNPVQPALSSASEREVGGVDGENAAFHQDAVVKPLREGDAHAADVAEIGRASCRERVGQYVELTGVAVALKKKT